jgi:hypothetical protein
VATDNAHALSSGTTALQKFSLTHGLLAFLTGPLRRRLRRPPGLLEDAHIFAMFINAGSLGCVTIVTTSRQSTRHVVVPAVG